MLRRTKVERTEELGLPPRVVTVRRDVFNEAEEELYESLYSDSVRTFSTYVANETVLNNYASIFSLLSRMRLAANHPDLVTTRMKLGDGKGAKENLVCGVCQEEAEDAVMSRCKHVSYLEWWSGFFWEAGWLCSVDDLFCMLMIDFLSRRCETVHPVFSGGRESYLSCLFQGHVDRSISTGGVAKGRNGNRG